VEELRHRIDEHREDRGGAPDGKFIGEVRPGAPTIAVVPAAPAIEPRDQAPPPNLVTIEPGMKMADIERAAIEAALKETRGNRRRAADMLGIGERTLYRKIKEYRMPEYAYGDES
jgi:DNA-binding NtrC family response regulator